MEGRAIYPRRALPSTAVIGYQESKGKEGEREEE